MHVYVAGKCLSAIAVVLGPFHEVYGKEEQSNGLFHTERKLLKDMTG